jgi:hypothetical protein
MSMLHSGLRRRGRATTQRALAFYRGIADCTRYRAVVERALVQILYKTLGAIFFGGWGDTRARATEMIFQPLLLRSSFASCLMDYLETGIQNRSSMFRDVGITLHPKKSDLSGKRALELLGIVVDTQRKLYLLSSAKFHNISRAA